MKTLQEAMGYTFKNQALLRTALTHSSYYNENRKSVPDSNERLEFLGDSVLGFLTARYLFEKHKSKNEGELTRLRAALVCETHLSQVAAGLRLNEYLLLGKGEKAAGGQNRPSILSDALEAVLAALYLDGGMDTARIFAESFIFARRPSDTQDFKTQLQELLQREPGHVFTYRPVSESGPEHAKVFTVELVLDDQVIGRGEGGSKKEAEQKAAAQGILKLGR